MLLPGPEAQQLATYVGWLLHGAKGAIAAGVLFVLPGALLMLALSALYASFADLTLVAGLFYGVKAAVIAVVIEALLRISKRALKTAAMWTLAGAAFAAIFLFAAPFPLIVLAAALIGYAGALARPDFFPAPDAKGGPASLLPERSRGALRNAAVALALWLGPLIGLVIFCGRDHMFTEAAVFFSKMAVLTFGGAYAVLAYVAQEAVAVQGWLLPGELLDGLGLAETTPGPLVLVLEFVGFLAGFRAGTGLPPLVSGAVGALIAVWFTFAPCFFWIFLGAPFMERLRDARALNAALSAVTAAVVGVVLNLAVFFTVHVLFRDVATAAVGPLRIALPEFGSLDPVALALAVGAGLALLRFHVGMIATLVGAAALGAGLRLAGLA
ncbi:MAG: chromate transporter [Parvularculaceae bacterium]